MRLIAKEGHNGSVLLSIIKLQGDKAVNLVEGWSQNMGEMKTEFVQISNLSELCVQLVIANIKNQMPKRNNEKSEALKNQIILFQIKASGKTISMLNIPSHKVSDQNVQSTIHIIDQQVRFQNNSFINNRSPLTRIIGNQFYD